MKVLIFSCLLLALANAQTGWFTKIDGKGTWDQAKEACRAKGLVVAVIDTPQKQATLEKEVALSGKQYWLGAKYDSDDGWDTWIDGSPMMFQNWKHGQGRDINGQNQPYMCTGWWNSWEWHDCDRHTRLHYLCSKPSIMTGERILTQLDCEVTNLNHRQWDWTIYGPHGGSNSYTKAEGRIFEMDCQTPYCTDSEGETGHWWFTCGKSWRQSNELLVDDEVIIDVTTHAYNRWDSTCPGDYRTVAHWDATGELARGSNGHWGHWTFQLCTLKMPWGKVLKSQTTQSREKVVKDVEATLKPKHPDDAYHWIGQWDTANHGDNLVYDGSRHTRFGGYFFLHVKLERPKVYFSDTTGYWRRVGSRECNDCDPETRTYTTGFSSSETETETNEQITSFTNTESFQHQMAVTASAELGMNVEAGYEFTHTTTHEQTTSSHAINSLQSMTGLTIGESITTYSPRDSWVLWAWTVYRNANYGSGAVMTTTTHAYKTGNCRNYPPNCLPGTCAGDNNECADCSSPSDKIDPNGNGC